MQHGRSAYDILISVDSISYYNVCDLLVCAREQLELDKTTARHLIWYVTNAIMHNQGSEDSARGKKVHVDLDLGLWLPRRRTF